MSLLVNCDDQEFEIRFGHINLATEIHGRVCQRRCSVVDVSVDGSPLSRGISVCHPDDRFNKSFGRKRAMTKALEVFSKSTRKAIWYEYIHQIGP